MEDCVRQVRSSYPHAVAASYHAHENGHVTDTECFAVEGTEREADGHRRSCIFEDLDDPATDPPSTAPPTSRPGNGWGRPSTPPSTAPPTSSPGNGWGRPSTPPTTTPTTITAPTSTPPTITPPTTTDATPASSVTPGDDASTAGLGSVTDTLAGGGSVGSTPGTGPALFRCQPNACGAPRQGLVLMLTPCTGCLAGVDGNCAWTTVDHDGGPCAQAIASFPPIRAIPDATTSSRGSTATASVTREQFRINIGDTLPPGGTLAAAGDAEDSAEDGTVATGSSSTGDGSDSSSGSSVPMVVGIMVAVLLCVVLVAVVMVRTSEKGLLVGTGNERVMTLNPTYMLSADNQSNYVAPVAANPAKYGEQQYSQAGPGGHYDSASGVERLYDQPGGGSTAAPSSDYAEADSHEYSTHQPAVNPWAYARGQATADYDTAGGTVRYDGYDGGQATADYDTASGTVQYADPMAADQAKALYDQPMTAGQAEALYNLGADQAEEEQYALASPGGGGVPSLYAVASPDRGLSQTVFWYADDHGQSTSDGAIYTADAGQSGLAPLTDIYAQPTKQDHAAVWAVAKQWLGLPAALITKAYAESLLAGPAQPGAFLIRSKTGGGGGQVLSVQSASAKVVHHRIDESDGMFTLLDTNVAEAAFTSLERLILGHVHTGTVLPATGVSLGICVPPPAALRGVAPAAEDELVEIDGFGGKPAGEFLRSTGSMSRKPSVYDGFAEI